jgi:hypothetical protein
MRSSLIFFHHYRKNRYAEALSALPTPVRSRGLLPRHWACYRLGLYGTVSGSAHQKLKTWRDAFAVTVSLAACGRHDEAAEAAMLAEARYGARRDFHQLVDALAPFMAALALELIEGKQAPISLSAALLQANGRNLESLRLLEGAFRKGLHMETPELYLYRSNAGSWSNRELLDFLNSYLGSHGIPQVGLLDPDQPPGTRNLVSAVCLPSVESGPLVSILMTTFQSGEHVDTAIASVLGQTWKNIELIVVDDASTDDTVERITRWAERDRRVRLISLPRNVGTYVAKNIGLQSVGGEFVTCHDSDDWSHPLKIERQVQPLLQDSKLVCTTSDWVRMQDDGIYYARPVHPLKRFNPSSPLFRRMEVLERAGAWDWVRTGADSEFVARLKLVFGRKAVRNIRQPLALGSHRPDSLMTDPLTGFTSGMVPPVRQAYWEAWNYWHIGELREKRAPRMPDMTSSRAFTAPDEILVSQEAIERCCREAEPFAGTGYSGVACA